jgi:hypothetical protein
VVVVVVEVLTALIQVLVAEVQVDFVVQLALLVVVEV